MEESELCKINDIALAKLLWHFINKAMETSESVKPNDIVADLDICVSSTVVDSESQLCTIIGQHNIIYWCKSLHTYNCTEVILSLGSEHLYGKGIIDIARYHDLDHEVWLPIIILITVSCYFLEQTLRFLINLSLTKYRRGFVSRLMRPKINLSLCNIGVSDADCNYYAAEVIS